MPLNFEQFRNAIRKEKRGAILMNDEDEYEMQWRTSLRNRETVWNKGVNNVTFDVKPIPLIENNLAFISDNLAKMAQTEINKVLRAFPAGANMYMKVLLQSDAKDATASSVVKLPRAGGDRLYDAIFAQMAKIANKAFPTEDYFLNVTSVMILVSGFGAFGGCNEERTKMLSQVYSKNVKVKFIDHKSIENNCLLQCFNHAYGVAGNKLKSSSVRKSLGLKDGEKIHMDSIDDISKFYNSKFDKQKGYVLINPKFEILKFSHSAIRKSDYQVGCDDRENIVQIMLRNDHYLSYEVVTYRVCDKCGEKLLSTNSTHKCAKEQASFYATKISKKHDIVKSVKIEEELIDYEKIVHFDFETFQPEGEYSHVPYACGVYDGKYSVYYGKDTLDGVIDKFLTFEDRTLSAYNGSAFDYTFIVRALSNRGAIIENMIMKSGRIMSFTYRAKRNMKRNKVFDLYLFTMCGLAKACKDFKVSADNQKGDFDHSKIRNWDDVETHKQEVLPYVKADVLGLKELFEIFNDMIYKLKKTNITRYITCSHMGYMFWQEMNSKIIEIPKDLTKMDFIGEAVYGGRCYPQQRTYESSMYADVKSGKLTYADVIGSKSKDFIYNADATSLYPASMSGFKEMKVKYPIGFSRWSEEPKKEFDAGLMGFYQIDFIAPKDLRVPILPRRKLQKDVNIGVSWSLEDGSGIYTSVDIENAIDAGYKVSFKGKALVYDKSGNVFKKYIDEFYELKGTAEKEKNASKRGIAKLMLNSLYGKMLMSPVDTQTEIVNNAIELNEFLLKYDLTDYHIVYDKMLVSGTTKGERKVKCINKPRQLGAFVTAYSRRIMLYYMKKIDPTLKEQIFTYTDTDSLHIRGDAYLKLLKEGMVKLKENAELGYLCSDIDGEGLILKEINLAPKTYFYEYIDCDGKIGSKIKCKGINNSKKSVTSYHFDKYEEWIARVREEKEEKMNGVKYTKAAREEKEKNDERRVTFFSMKKKTTNLTSADREKGVALFSVCNNPQTRTFMKSVWDGMYFDGKEYYPWGHANIPDDYVNVDTHFIDEEDEVYYDSDDEVVEL